MKRSRGQSLVETALMLPVLLVVVLNVINLGYFFLVVVNLTGAARSATLYSIEGSYTPFAGAQPAAGSTNCATSPNTVACLAFQDLTGAVWNPTNTNNTILICSNSNINTGTGQGTASSGYANCQQYNSTGCIWGCGGSAGPFSTVSDPEPLDPEAPNFVANHVTITYQFQTLIPGTFFNAALQAMPSCTGSTCTFRRYATMRSMGP